MANESFPRVGPGDSVSAELYNRAVAALERLDRTMPGGAVAGVFTGVGSAVVAAVKPPPRYARVNLGDSPAAVDADGTPLVGGTLVGPGGVGAAVWVRNRGGVQQNQTAVAVPAGTAGAATGPGGTRPLYAVGHVADALTVKVLQSGNAGDVVAARGAGLPGADGDPSAALRLRLWAPQAAGDEVTAVVVLTADVPPLYFQTPTYARTEIFADESTGVRLVPSPVAPDVFGPERLIPQATGIALNTISPIVFDPTQPLSSYYDSYNTLSKYQTGDTITVTATVATPANPAGSVATFSAAVGAVVSDLSAPAASITLYPTGLPAGASVVGPYTVTPQARDYFVSTIPATPTQVGAVTDGAQTWAGPMTFLGGLSAGSCYIGGGAGLSVGQSAAGVQSATSSVPITAAVAVADSLTCAKFIADTFRYINTTQDYYVALAFSAVAGPDGSAPGATGAFPTFKDDFGTQYILTYSQGVLVGVSTPSSYDGGSC